MLVIASTPAPNLAPEATTTQITLNKYRAMEEAAEEYPTDRNGDCQLDKIMKYVLIIHEVEDYQSWKKVFDDAANIRKEAGEIAYQVLKYESDPNKVVHFSSWTSIEDAKRFFESPQLVKIRSEAGVKSPDFIYLDQLESGTL